MSGKVITHRGTVLKKLRTDGLIEDAWTASLNEIIERAKQEELANEWIFPLRARDPKTGKLVEVSSFENARALGAKHHYAQAALSTALTMRVMEAATPSSKREFVAQPVSRESSRGIPRERSRKRREFRGETETRSRVKIRRDPNGRRSIPLYTGRGVGSLRCR